VMVTNPSSASFGAVRQGYGPAQSARSGLQIPQNLSG
jgi:hypothetical protein